MAKYKINADLIGVLDTETGMNIPLVSGNRHYREFVEWVDAGNIPDNSLTVKEFVDIKKAEIKKAFEEGVQNGITVKSGRKYDSTMNDYIVLKGALDLAQEFGEKTIRVRDYEDKVHVLTPAQLKVDVLELALAYKQALYAKWSAQESASNEGYSQFAQGEIAKLMSIIEGNR